MICHKFLIGDVLKKVTTKKLPLKAKTLPKTTNGDKSLVPLMAAGVENQGCVGYVKPNEPTVLHNLITISANGANSGATFYQQRKFSILQDAYALELVDKYADYASDDVYLYLTAVVDHRLKDNGYNNKATWNRIKNYYIELPVTPAGQPDFEYMTARIRELETQRIRELETYLQVTGLDDTKLSASEVQALTQKVQWKKFRIGDVLEKADAKFKDKRIDIQHDVSKVRSEEFDLPVVSVLSDHNGVMYYGRSPEWTSVSNSIDIVQNGAKATGCVFYQPEATSSFRDAYLVKFKGRELTPEQSLYMVGSLKAVLPKAFSRDQLATWTRVQDAVIQLPVTLTGDINLDYMQTYIRALEKQTIKGVVEYKDKVIQETKKVVNG